MKTILLLASSASAHEGSDGSFHHALPSSALSGHDETGIAILVLFALIVLAASALPRATANK